MDDLLFAQIKKAAEESIKNPGGKKASNLPQNESECFPEIYVFRHGESFDNKNKVFSGWRDAQLTDIGIEQAEKLAEVLKGKHIDLCITSPLSRSKQTAKIALKYHPHIIFEEDPRIIERNYGELQGTKKDSLQQQDPELATKYRRAYDFPPPNGESLEMVEKRVIPFCNELIERVRRNNINIAISAHGNSMRVIRRFFENLSLLDMLIQENPLATTYAQYTIELPKISLSHKGLDKGYLDKLVIPDSALIPKLIRE